MVRHHNYYIADYILKAQLGLLCYSYFMASNKIPKVCAFTLTQKEFRWHNEDSYLASKKFPIYAVADGVTMPMIHELMTPSESKLASDKFCRKSVAFLEKHFRKLSLKTIKSTYSYANRDIAKLNKGRRHKLSATAALAVVKDGGIFASRLCDSGFALIREGKMVFKTPEFWSLFKAKKSKRYGVLDGATQSLKYIDFYKLKYKNGDILALFTDGFENHFSKKEFISLFQAKNMNQIEAGIKKVDAKLIKNNSEKFGHERTLLMVRLNH